MQDGWKHIQTTNTVFLKNRAIGRIVYMEKVPYWEINGVFHPFECWEEE